MKRQKPEIRDLGSFILHFSSIIPRKKSLRSQTKHNTLEELREILREAVYAA